MRSLRDSHPLRSLHATPPPGSDQATAGPLKIWMGVLDSQRADCTILVTPAYLDFMLTHPAFHPLRARFKKHRWGWN